MHRICGVYALLWGIIDLIAYQCITHSPMPRISGTKQPLTGIERLFEV